MVVRYSSKTGNPAVQPALSANVSYTPAYSASMGTIADSSMLQRQTGDKRHISGRFTIGTVTAATATMGLPNGEIVAQGAGPGQRWVVGRWVSNNAAATSIKNGPIYALPGDAFLTFGSDERANAIGGLAPQDAVTLWGNGSIISIQGEIVVPTTAIVGQANIAVGAGLATSARAGLIKSYEEGVFTPIFSCSTTAPTLTYTTQTAAYTKTGRMVFFTLRITVNTVSSVGAGNIVIAGFPYLTAYGNLQSVTIGFAANWQFQAPVNAAMNANGSIELFFKGGQQNNTSSLPAASFQAGSDIAISGFYMAAS